MPVLVSQVITIDDRYTRDIDDAVWVERLDNGWRVNVAITDVARAVPMDSPTDVEALKRVATQYFGTGNSPMLPRFLSDRKLSLRPGKKRPCVAIEMTLGDDLKIKSTTVHEVLIESAGKVSYAEIPDILDDADHVFHGMLKSARSLAMGLLEQHRANGALMSYDLNHAWVSTEEGFLKKLDDKKLVMGYIIIQQLMVLANAEVANKMGSEVPLLYRNHELKDASLDREALIAQLQEAIKAPLHGLEELRKKAHLAMGRAEYGATNVGHYGTNLPAYIHFTSPIRRYADLVNQRQIQAHLRGNPPPYTQAQIQDIATFINVTTIEIAESRVAKAKEKAEGVARKAIDARRLDALNAKGLERAVKVEARSGEDATEAFTDGYMKRLGDGVMPLLCRTVVLGEAPDGPRWTKLKSMILLALARQPEDAVSMLAQGHQTGFWPAAEFERKAAGPSHQQIFTSTGTLDDLTFTVVDTTAKRAKQKAAVGLLALLSGLDAPVFKEPPEPVETPSAPAKASSNGGNPVGALGEYAAGRALPMPDYSYTKSGPSHMPTFTCTCEFQGEKKTAVAAAKKEAKKLAAKAMIEALS